MPEGETADEVPVASLARLWPNREHESSWLKNLLCTLGLHRWHELDIGRLLPNEKATLLSMVPEDSLSRQIVRIELQF
jgi:hypothetical protein